MAQLQLPVFPAGVTPINNQIAVACESGKVVYVLGHQPVFRKRMTKYRVAGSAGGVILEGGKSNQRRQEAQAAGVSSPTRRMETLAKPGNTEPRYSRTGSFIRRVGEL